MVTKESYIGKIPQDWTECPWGEVLDGFKTGITPSRRDPDYFKGNNQWFTSGELKKHYIHDSVEKISKKAISDTNIVIHPVGTFVMAIIGLEAEGTRGSCALLGTESAINQSCVAIYGTSKLSAEYLYYFYAQYGVKLDLEFCQGTKQQNLSSDIVKKFPICFPPDIGEQTRIVHALSDVDELIANLEKLIEKKKAIKQGAMQELLTGKRRLPGFSGEWREYEVGTLGDYYQGLSGKTKESFGTGDSKYIPFMNVLYNTVIDSSYLDTVDVKQGEKQNAVKVGDLFFNTSSETPEEVGMCAVLLEDLENTYLNSFCFGFRLREDKHSGLFISYLFNSCIGRKIMYLLAQGATRYNLSKANFSKTKIILPEKEEQEAIASLLSDIDAEITELSKKLEKYKNLKQGMMQKLLTGEIRLV